MLCKSVVLESSLSHPYCGALKIFFIEQYHGPAQKFEFTPHLWCILQRLSPVAVGCLGPLFSFAVELDDDEVVDVLAPPELFDLPPPLFAPLLEPRPLPRPPLLLGAVAATSGCWDCGGGLADPTAATVAPLTG